MFPYALQDTVRIFSLDPLVMFYAIDITESEPYGLTFWIQRSWVNEGNSA